MPYLRPIVELEGLQHFGAHCRIPVVGQDLNGIVSSNLPRDALLLPVLLPCLPSPPFSHLIQDRVQSSIIYIKIINNIAGYRIYGRISGLIVYIEIFSLKKYRNV